MRRAGIYLFYDAEGVVGSYIDYFLKELKTVVDYLVVVVNGKLTQEGRKKFAALADDFFVRENSGFDAWAYKTAIEYIGWDTLKKFDELVIANYTIYGPVFPFADIFKEMECSTCDFWGMFTNYEDRNMKSFFGVPLKWGYKPESLASNFCVYKSSVLHSYEFYTHWKTLPPIKNYYESSVFHEWALTKMLADAGFTYRVVDHSKFQRKCPSPTVYAAYELLADYHVPVIRKKVFYDPNGTLDYCTDIPRKIMQYLAEHTDYNCDLIWEDLLRTVNQYDLKNWFNWNTILPDDFSYASFHRSKVAVIFHNYYPDIMGKYIHNIASFPDGTDFYFTTDTEEKRKLMQTLTEPLKERFSMEFRLVENRGRDVSALLVGCRDVIVEGRYDLICFMHDKKGIGNSSAGKYSCVGDSFSDCCFENVAASSDYVHNVISLFEQNSRLGIAVPPPPRNANYYKVIGGSWAAKENYIKSEQLLRELDISVPMDEKKPPVAPYGSVFWFRPDSLLPLFKKMWEYDDFEAEPMKSDGTISNAIERSHSLIAQGMGYYPTVIMSTRYAEQEVTRMTEIAHTYIDFTLQSIGPKSILKTATNQFAQMLQRKGLNSTTVFSPGTKSSESINCAQDKKRGPLKKIMRAICPIGLWNLMRRIKCLLRGGVYKEPKVQRSGFKTFIRACMPRFLWDQLRKSKCRENGWVFVPED